MPESGLVLWDPKDDMVLEVAVAGRCQHVVMFDARRFRGIQRFGVKAVTPKEFLRVIGELK